MTITLIVGLFFALELDLEGLEGLEGMNMVKMICLYDEGRRMEKLVEIAIIFGGGWIIKRDSPAPGLSGYR